jgi:drug/metabolite transporter (DMT)-like permease
VVKGRDIVVLVGINLLYACVGICTKMAAMSEPLSWPYLLWFIGAVGIIGAYAVLWQQVLRRVELSTAYMFKGTTLIFTMLIAALLFGESITVMNIIVSVIIVTGITLLART